MPKRPFRTREKTRQGHEEIARWFENTKAKYQQLIEPLSIRQDGDDYLMTAKVSGTFDGSPVELEYRFVMKEERIHSVSIE